MEKELKLLKKYKRLSYRLLSTLFIISKCEPDDRTAGIAISPENHAQKILDNIFGKDSKEAKIFYNYLSLAEGYITTKQFYKAHYAVITAKGENLAEKNILTSEIKKFMSNNLKEFIKKKLPELEKKDRDIFLIIIRTLKEIAKEKKSRIIAPDWLYSIKGPEKVKGKIKEAKKYMADLIGYDKEKDVPLAIVEYTYVNSKGNSSEDYNEYMMLPEFHDQINKELKYYEEDLKKFENEEKNLEWNILDRIRQISISYHRATSIYELSQYIQERLGTIWNISHIKNVLNKFCNYPAKYLYEEEGKYYIEPEETENFEKHLESLKKKITKGKNESSK